MTATLLSAIESVVGAGNARADVMLAPLTTFRIGGCADLLAEPHGEAEVLALLDLARQHELPVTILGGGSNILVSDRGVRGLVIRPRGGSIADEGNGRTRADAAVTMNGLVRWTIARGLQGLEAWAGTPGTVGGAVHGNAHFGGRTIDGLILSVRHANAGGVRFILSACFALQPGADPVRLREVARQSLAYRKRTQPLGAPSAGCIFRNPDPDQVPPGIPASAGALIDRAGLKGRSIGGARVSPVHANFIVNDGEATAASVRELIEVCREAVLSRFGVRLCEEIVYVGEW